MATILYTSLVEIKSFNPCPEGWKNILRGQNKTEADDILFPLIDCLNSNTISDICWLLGKRKIEIGILVNFAKKCADSVKHFNNSYTAYAVANAVATAVAANAANAYAVANAAAYAVANATNAVAAYNKQKKLNKQFLIECIKEWEESH